MLACFLDNGPCINSMHFEQLLQVGLTRKFQYNISGQYTVIELTWELPVLVGCRANRQRDID